LTITNLNCYVFLMNKKSVIKNCCVRHIDKSNCFVCLSQEQDRDKCPHVIKSTVLEDVYCDNPDVDGFPRKPLSKDSSKRPKKICSTKQQETTPDDEG
jgi:hypothetical protein